jgi:hypothetical protein
MDGLIRNHVKGILHLPPSTLNGIFYCAKRDGGLGIPKLEMLTVSSTLMQGLTVLNTFDSSLQALFQSSKLEQRLHRLAPYSVQTTYEGRRITPVEPASI